MKNKLKPCPACQREIATGAATCPHCGKRSSTPAGLILALLIGLIIGGVLIARTVTSASRADAEMEEIQKDLLRGR